MPVYSVDLRERIVEAVQQGESKAQVARRFKVDRSTVYAYLAQQQRQGHLEPKANPGRPPAISQQELDRLERQLDATLAEHRDLWQEATGQHLSTTAIHRAFGRLNVTRKKDAHS